MNAATRWTCTTAMTAAALGALVAAQTAIPTREGRGAQPAQGQGGRGPGGQGRRGGAPPQPSNLPSSPMASPLPMVSGEITGPGRIFETLMELPADDNMAHYKYEAKEYFVSGTANGQPYKT